MKEEFLLRNGVIAPVQRSLSWKDFKSSVYDTLRISCMVIVIITGAMIFGRFLAITQIPFDIADWVITRPFSKMTLMGIIFIIYIIGGALMDALALLLITIPIIFPVAMELGYDPIWFGVTITIVITIVTTLGAVTPPVGATTYVWGVWQRIFPLKGCFGGWPIFCRPISFVYS